MIKNAVYCTAGMQHFGRPVAEILDWPLYVDTQVGHVDKVLIVGMYDPPFYGFTLEATKFAKERVIHWCGTDVAMLVESRALPFATHICDGEALQRELLQKGVEASVVYQPTGIHPPMLPSSTDEKVIAFYSGANAEQYGASVVTAAMECLPDWKLFSYKLGQFSPEEMLDVVKECTAYIRLTKHDGGMVSAREFLEAGKPAIVTSDLKYAKVVSPDNLTQVVKAIRDAGKAELNSEAHEYYKWFNSPERYLEDLRGVGVIE